MNTLQTLQQQFQAFLMQNTSAIETSIVSTEKVLSQERLQVYQNAYEIRLVEALAINYPCMKTFVGEELFFNIAKDYLQQHPSTHRSIRWYGDLLPAFLQSYPHEQSAYLAMLADFEWKMALSFDAADAKIFLLEDMASVPIEAWADMKIVFHPSVMRADYRWNVVALWQSIANATSPVNPEQYASLSSWVIYRKDYQQYYYQLNSTESLALDAILQGKTFGEVCEALCDCFVEEEVAMKAAGYLKGWITTGLVSDIVVSTLA